MRRLRRDHGWSQEELAERMGKDRRQVGRLESGTASVSIETLALLSEVFGVLAHAFMWSIPGSGAEDPAEEQDRDLAREELRRRFGARADRLMLLRLLRLGVLLDDDRLHLLVAVADALASPADGSRVPDRPFLLDPIDYSRTLPSPDR